MIEPQEPLTMNRSLKRNISWVRENIQEPQNYGVPEGSTRVSKRSNPFSTYVALMCDLIDKETTNYEEAMQNKEWVEAMI